MAAPEVGTAIVMDASYEEASKPYLQTVRQWFSLAAYNRPGINPGGAACLGAFQRYPRAFVFAGGPR